MSHELCGGRAPSTKPSLVYDRSAVIASSEGWFAIGDLAASTVALAAHAPLAALADDHLVRLLIEGGGAVGGAAAIGGVVAFVAWAIARDVGYIGDRTRWIERGIGYGGVFGLAAVILVSVR